ncbi:MAG TPA: universal stress protein, partial [Longimicrobiales bacterium]
MGRALGRPVEAVAVYDPYLHYAMFNGIVGVLSQEASKVFRFKEQEQLHEEIIDTGLAKIYESHLQVARRVAEQEGVDLKVTLLDGKAWEKVAHWARQEQPWLLVMGRIGVHSDDEMDIGSNTEHLLRAAGCNVLLASGTYVPPVDVRAEEVIIWTPEANQKMERVPQFVRGIARTAIHRWAMERGTSIISTDIIDEACLDILPPSAAKAMGIVAKRVAVAHELAAPETSAGRLPPGAEGHSGKTYICGECGYAARDVLPVACPICRSGPERFAIIDRREIEAAAAHQGPIAEHETFDGQKVAWTEEARRLLFSMTDAYARRRAKARIEKQARTRRLPVVTIEFASPVVQEMIGDLARLHGPNPPAPFPLRWEGGAGVEGERTVLVREGGVDGERLAQSPALAGDGAGAEGERVILTGEGVEDQPSQSPSAAWEEGAEGVRTVQVSANERVEADGQVARSADPQGTKAPEIDSRAMDGRGTNGQGEEPGVSALPWTLDALARLDRVPAGYMRDMTRDLVLQHAAGSGAAEVTLVVCEAGIAVAKREMVAMIAAHSARKTARAQANGHTAGTNPAASVD